MFVCHLHYSERACKTAMHYSALSPLNPRCGRKRPRVTSFKLPSLMQLLRLPELLKKLLSA